MFSNSEQIRGLVIYQFTFGGRFHSPSKKKKKKKKKTTVQYLGFAVVVELVVKLSLHVHRHQ